MNIFGTKLKTTACQNEMSPQYLCDMFL